jgi:hypothetical protein
MTTGSLEIEKTLEFSNLNDHSSVAIPGEQRSGRNNHWRNILLDHTMNQTIDQSFNQSSNQSINQSAGAEVAEAEAGAAEAEAAQAEAAQAEAAENIENTIVQAQFAE